MNSNPSDKSGPPEATNPYFAQPMEAPTQGALDAGAPTLSSSSAQRVNRKAVLFLAGAVALLAALAFLVFHGATKDKSPASEPRPEQVSVPDAPTMAPALPQTPPIALASSNAGIPAIPTGSPMSMEAGPGSTELSPLSNGPSLVDRRVMGVNPSPENPLQAELAALESPPRAAAVQVESTKATAATYLNQPDSLMLRGTYIRCALETRIITDINGFASCVVTEPVYSVNGRRLLLPRGSKVLGQYGSGAIKGERVAVVWDRIVTPTGIDVSMASPGVDGMGSAGHPGDYDAHWASRITSALLISLLSDAFKYYGEKEGPVTTTAYPGAGAVVQEPFESNTARTVQDLANQAIEAGGKRSPTVTINQGTVLNVYVSQDVDFSAVLRN